jgi:hypothetical protein
LFSFHVHQSFSMKNEGPTPDCCNRTGTQSEGIIVVRIFLSEQFRNGCASV